MTTDEIVDKIWAEHDHNKDDNFLYCDGWTDACNRFYQELKGKSLVEWHKPSNVLPNNYDCVLCYVKKTKSYEVMEYDKTYKHFSTSEGAVFKVNDVIAWCYLPKYRGVDNE